MAYNLVLRNQLKACCFIPTPLSLLFPVLKTTLSVNWGWKCLCSFQLRSTRYFWKRLYKMMETVDIIRDLLKTVMKGQKWEEKKKRPNEERDKEGRSRDRRTCCEPVVERRCRHMEQRCGQRWALLRRGGFYTETGEPTCYISWLFVPCKQTGKQLTGFASDCFLSTEFVFLSSYRDGHSRRCSAEDAAWSQEPGTSE